MLLNAIQEGGKIICHNIHNIIRICVYKAPIDMVSGGISLENDVYV